MTPGAAGQGNPARVLLDCDPGIDDALAIVFGCGHPGLDLAGLTTVSGNVNLDTVTGNALSVLELAGRPDVAVVPGSARPLLRPTLDAREVHGEGGLGAARLPPAQAAPASGHAVDYLIDTIGAAPGEITLVATGPLTNIALAVRREPRLPGWVRDFVIMGGSAGRGNVTPAAEFNIAADPEAAAIVFDAGWQVTMVGLDVTLQARAGADVQDRMSQLGRLGRDLLLPGLLGYRGEHAQAAGRPAGARRVRTRPGGRARPVRLRPGPGGRGDRRPVHLRDDRHRLLRAVREPQRAGRHDRGRARVLGPGAERLREDSGRQPVPLRPAGPAHLAPVSWPRR